MRYLNLQGKNQAIHCYKIADSLYQSDGPIAGLEYLRQTHCLVTGPTQSLLTSIDTATAGFKPILAPLFTPIGENTYALEVFTNAAGDYVLKNNADSYHIDKNTIATNVANVDLTLLMGPVMLLHLAQNQIFCLHASAFKLHDTCFVLMADSGTGKSTIARYINNNSIGQRIADDIVPLGIVADKITVFGHFPQLKLTQAQQYTAEDICQKTILLFVQKSEHPSQLVEMNAFQTLKNLIKHSVASKLFNAHDLNQHLQFCHAISSQAQAYAINYQHSLDGLKHLCEGLNDLA